MNQASKGLLNSKGITTLLSGLDLGGIRQDRKHPQRNACVTDVPLKVGGTAFARGIGTSGDSSWRLTLDGKLAINLSSYAPASYILSP